MSSITELYRKNLGTKHGGRFPSPDPVTGQDDRSRHSGARTSQAGVPPPTKYGTCYSQRTIFRYRLCTVELKIAILRTRYILFEDGDM